MKKIDLTSQFIIYLAITLIGVIGAMNLWSYYDHTGHQKEALENRVSAKLDFIESSSGYYLEHFEYELVEALGREAMATDQDVLFLSIEDENGEKIFEQGGFVENHVRNFSRRIIHNGKKLGNVKLALNIQPLVADQQKTLLYAIGLMIFSILLIFGIIYLFYRKKILYELARVNREKEFLSEEQEFLMTIINTASNLVVVLDHNGRINIANQVCVDYLDSSVNALIGRNIMSVIDFDCGQSAESPMRLGGNAGEFRNISRTLLQRQCKSLLSRSNAEIHVEWSFSKIEGKGGRLKFLVGTGVDITRQHKKQLELSHQAHHDQLTALPNRTLFNDRLQESFKQAKRQSTLFAVLFVDLDHFKPINDQYGHEVGDLVLKVVSQRMQTVIRELDTVARLGGDEFGVLLLDVKKKENIHRLAKKLLEAIATPIVYGDEMLSVEASIGIAFYSEKTKDAKELIRQADEAMYRAKSAGRNTYVCFNEIPSLASISAIHKK